jgi:hypothetical protein
MNSAGRLEQLLATLFSYGSWLAAATIGIGFTLALTGSNSRIGNPAILPTVRIATAGIVLFILLPVIRVLLMLLVFIRERDFRFASIAGLVLVIIFLGIVLGFPQHRARPDGRVMTTVGGAGAHFVGRHASARKDLPRRN